jgi:hypothetical protein
MKYTKVSLDVTCYCCFCLQLMVVPSSLVLLLVLLWFRFFLKLKWFFVAFVSHFDKYGDLMRALVFRLCRGGSEVQLVFSFSVTHFP